MIQVWTLVLILHINNPLTVGTYSSAQNCSAAAQNMTTNAPQLERKLDPTIWYCIPNDATVSGRTK